MINLALFGRFQLIRDGIDITERLQYNSARALLAYLAVEGGTHARSTLAGLLWSENSEQEARNSLRQTLFKLRALLGKSAVQTTRQSVTLAEMGAVDVVQLRTALDSYDATGEIATLIATLSQYQAPLLNDVSLWESILFQEWVLMARERLHRRVMTAFDVVVAHEMGVERWESAEKFATHQLAIDGWREHTHRQLMTIYWQQGKHGAAVAQFEQCRQLLWEELGVAPTQETVALWETIQQQAAQPSDTPPLPPSPAHNLPADPTPFIGRKRELAALAEQQHDPACRLLTLVGQGGMGKTRLAMAYGREQIGRFTDGVFWVDLSGIEGDGDDGERLLAAVIEALPLQPSGRNPLRQQLQNYLRNKQLLLVLDNCEQLLDVIGVVGDWLRAAPQLEIMATSREKLNLHEEWTFRVDGLTYPSRGDSAEMSDDTDAVKLFFQRARTIRPDYPLTVVEVPSAARICRMVEGMPLAIELAAGWLEVLSPSEIVREITQGLAILTSATRNLPARHRSIHTVLERTWQTLSPHEQAVMAQLSVFRGGFTRIAASEVTGATLLDLKRLVDKSLVRVRSEQKRYELHRLVRQFSAEKLTDTTATQRHAAYFSAWMDQCGNRLHSPDYFAIVEAVLREYDNVQAAWQTAAAQLEVAWLEQMAPPLTSILGDMGRATEGVQLIEPSLDTLAQAGKSSLRLQTRAGFFLSRSNQFEAAAIHLEHVIATAEQPELIVLAQLFLAYAHFLNGQGAEGLQVAKEAHANIDKVDDGYLHYAIFNTLALCSFIVGDVAAAEAYSKQAVANAERIAAPISLVVASTNWGNALVHQGKYAEANAVFEQCLANPNLRKIPYHHIAVLINRTVCLNEQAYWDESEATFEEALALARFVGESRLEAHLLNNLGCFHMDLQQFEQAETLLKQSLAMRREANELAGVALSLGHLSNVYLLTEQIATAVPLLREGIDIAVEIGNGYALNKLLYYGACWAVYVAADCRDQVVAYVLNDPNVDAGSAEKMRTLLAEIGIPEPDTALSVDEVVGLLSAEFKKIRPV